LKYIKLLIAVASLFVLTSCGKVLSQPSQTNTDANISTSTIKPSSWECNTTQESNGEYFGCNNLVTNSEGQTLVLTLLCGPDFIARHSVVRFKGYEMIPWKKSNNSTATVSLDSGPVEEWNIGFKKSAEGRVALTFNLISESDVNVLENKSTWELLKRIATSKTLKIQALDLEVNIQKAEFNVSDSEPLAAKFSALGCHG
jgi:hypothetical protein